MRREIERELHQLIDDFEKSAAGLFQITGRFVRSYDQGIYGCAIAKPTRRMATILAVDREILAVFSTFEDQQQRTIKFTRQEIDASQGRFEPTVAVVVHPDPEGSRKLKNWGRDSGLSVLSVPVREPFVSGDELERELRLELYSHDPFDVTGPVSDDANFFGRRSEALDLARKLQTGQIRSCLGIRKVGKTSVLNRVLGECRKNHDCLSVMVDCSRDDVWSLEPQALLAAIARAVQVAAEVGGAYQVVEPASGESADRGARELEKAVLAASRPVIVFFDEIDYITPGSPTNPQWMSGFNIFWRNLRAAYQELQRGGGHLSLLVGGVSSRWFTVEAIDGVENAAIAFVPEEYLSPLPRGATIAMLKRLSRIAGLVMSEEVARIVGATTADMPYWARKACSYLHRQIEVSSRPYKLQPAEVRAQLSEFVRLEGAALSEVALRHLFRVFPELFDASRLCYEGRANEVSEYHRTVLQRYGVVDAANGEMAGDMMRAGFDLYLSKELARTAVTARVPKLEEKDYGLGEWAEELAVLNRRRNLLEKKLRQVAANFIRFDSMKAGKSGEIADRVLGALSKKRREKLGKLKDVEQFLDGFFWMELGQLIQREWSLFKQVFGDRKRFDESWKIVNDRFDAHAKEVDVADVALYRRSLQFLEERLARLQ